MRRTWIAGLAGLAMLAPLPGCGSREPVVLPSDGAQLVAAYTNDGGFQAPSYLVIEAPALLVYADGRVIADARRTLTLERDEVAGLVGDLRGDLDGLDGQVESRDSRMIMDASGTTLAVRHDDGRLQTVSAYALGISSGYPRALVRAHQRLVDLGARVEKEGTAYTSDGVRLVLYQRDADAQPSASVPWPAGLSLPPKGRLGLNTADLTGTAARDVAAALPVDTWRTGPWPVYRMADGSLYAAAWRYLTPDESPLSSRP